MWKGGTLLIDAPLGPELAEVGIPQECEDRVRLHAPTVGYRGVGDGRVIQEVHQACEITTGPGDFIIMQSDMWHCVTEVTGSLRWALSLFFGASCRLPAQSLTYPTPK